MVARKRRSLGNKLYRQPHTTYQTWRRHCNFLGRDPVALGYLNADIGRLINSRDQQVAELLVSFGLVDLFGHLQQNLHYCNLKMWWKVCQGKIIQSWCDYVLGLDRRMYEKNRHPRPPELCVRPFPPLGMVAITTYPFPWRAPKSMTSLPFSAELIMA